MYLPTVLKRTSFEWGEHKEKAPEEAGGGEGQSMNQQSAL